MKSYKKILLTLLVVLCGMGVANAQLRFGVKAGLNLNSIHLNNAAANFDDDNKCGYTLGVMTEFQVPLIGLCFDLSAMYTRMNTELTEEQKDMNIGKDFLEIPLNIKYKFGLPIVGSIISPYLLTGPSVAIKLNKNEKGPDAIQTKGVQAVWNVGVGVELVKHLQIQGSYGFGMNNIAKHWLETANVKAKNNYWTVTAAYLF